MNNSTPTQQHSNLKPIIFIIAVVALIIGAVIYLSMNISKKEEITAYKTNPIGKIASTENPTNGLLTGFNGYIETINPDSGLAQENSTKLTIETKISQYEYKKYASYFAISNYKISPDGKYLAVLTPIDNTVNEMVGNTQNIKSAITVYNLKTRESQVVVDADTETAIISFAWDWNSSSIGFVTTKKHTESNNGLYLLGAISDSGSNKMFLNKVDLATGNSTSQEYKSSGGYSYSGMLEILTLNNNKYYLSNMGRLITYEDGNPIVEGTDTDPSGSTKIFYSKNYKFMAFVSMFDMVIYNLESKSKSTILISTGNLQGVSISAFDISHDGNEIIFVKSIPADKATSVGQSAYSSPYGSGNSTNQNLTIETIWYYNIQSKTYKNLYSRTLNVNSYEYQTSINILLSPDGTKVAAVVPSTDQITSTGVNSPFTEIKMKVFDIANSTSKEFVLNPNSGYPKLLHWQ